MPRTFSPGKPELSTAQCVTLACLLEVAAPKSGNVHRGADFEDLNLTDFLVGGVAIGPILAENGPLGARVLAAVRATRSLVQTNSNLGTILLLAPLAAVRRSEDIRSGVRKVLDDLDAVDSKCIYEAIRLANPAGMQPVDELDIRDAAPVNILDAMRAAADRDLVARQFANGFEQVFDFAVPALVLAHGSCETLTLAIIHTHLQLMAKFPDSLIARKSGEEVARAAAERAALVLQKGSPSAVEYQQALADLDFWLRCDGHRRNPGTTADMIAASLFVALRDGLIAPPY